MAALRLHSPGSSRVIGLLGTCGMSWVAATTSRKPHASRKAYDEADSITGPH